MEKHTKTGNLPTAEEFFEQGGTYPELAVEFAKLHVTKALTSAHINMQLPIEDLEFTLNSYPLTNIK